MPDTFLFRVVKSFEGTGASVDNFEGYGYHSNEYLYELEETDVNIQKVCENIVCAESYLLNSYSFQFVSVWKLKVGEKIDNKTPLLVLFPLVCYDDYTDALEAGGWTWTENYAYRTYTNPKTKETFVRFQHRDKRATNTPTIQPAPAYIALRLIVNRRGGHCHAQNYLNALTYFDVYVNSRGALKLRSDGPSMRRLEIFNHILGFNDAFRSSKYIDKDGVLRQGNDLWGPHIAVCASYMNAQRNERVRNRIALDSVKRVGDRLMFILDKFYGRLFDAAHAQKSGFVEPRFYNAENIRNGTDYEDTSDDWSFRSLALTIMEDWRERMTAVVDGALFQPRTVQPTHADIVFPFPKTSEFVDKGSGFEWSNNALNGLIDAVSQYPLYHTFLFSPPISGGFAPPQDHHWAGGSEVLPFEHIDVYYMFLGKASDHNYVVERTADWWKQMQDTANDRIFDVQKSFNVLGIWEKFTRLADSDHGAPPAPKARGKVAQSRFQASLDAFLDLGFKREQQGLMLLSNGLVMSAEHLPPFDLRKEENVIALYNGFVPRMRPYMLDYGPYTGEWRVLWVEKTTPPVALKKPPHKIRFKWDNTIHPLTSDEEHDEMCSLRKQQADNLRRVLLLSWDAVKLAIELDPEINPGPTFPLWDALIQFDIYGYTNLLNVCGPDTWPDVSLPRIKENFGEIQEGVNEVLPKIGLPKIGLIPDQDGGGTIVKAGDNSPIVRLSPEGKALPIIKAAPPSS